MRDPTTVRIPEREEALSVLKHLRATLDHIDEVGDGTLHDDIVAARHHVSLLAGFLNPPKPFEECPIPDIANALSEVDGALQNQTIKRTLDWFVAASEVLGFKWTPGAPDVAD